MSACGAARWGSCMATRSTAAFSIAISLLLTGCGPRLGSTLVERQVKSLLKESKISCEIAVSFRGVGEGDADNAYAIVRLGARRGNGLPHRDVNMLFSRFPSGKWTLQNASSPDLVKAARELCRAKPKGGRVTS